MIMDNADWVGQGISGGRYRVAAQLGEGGMGFVYRAHDRHLDCDVVIKVPRRAMLDDAEFAGRFAREIRSLVQLVHPHIVKVTDVGDHDGLPFAVMQFLPGGSLRDRQPAGPDGNPGPLPVEDLRRWLEAVASALDFIHGKNYIHRDIKPENILFDAEGFPYLSDFGVAKVLADKTEAKSKTVLTGSGMVLGTPQYMAPELLLGQPYDGRIDQYALAVTVYELLAGRYPFDGPTATAIFVQQTTQEAAPLEALVPSIPARTAAAVRRALAKDPNDRYPDCASFARAALAGIGQAPVPSGKARGPKGAATGAAAKATCPGCRKVVGLPPAALGKRIRCPACGEAFQAPAAPPAKTRDTGRVEVARADRGTAAISKPPLPQPAPVRVTPVSLEHLTFSAGAPVPDQPKKTNRSPISLRGYWTWLVSSVAVLGIGMTLVIGFAWRHLAKAITSANIVPKPSVRTPGFGTRRVLSDKFTEVGEVRKLVGHEGGIGGVVFFPDGAHILSASSDKTVRLWNVATGKELRRFDKHTEGAALSERS